jgi:S1-C subfamily serine protease
MLVDGQVKDRLEGMQTADRLERMCRLGTQPPRQGLLARLTGAKKAPPPALPASKPRLAADPFRQPAKAGPANVAIPPATGGTTNLAASAGPSDADLLAATVRLRIEDPTGHSWGTGAIIDARQGEALILTCGHVFREYKQGGKIEVDLFGPTPARHVPGRLVRYDLKLDVGLVAIAAPGPLVVARVAPAGYQIRPGDAAASAGCNNGDDPTVQRSQVIFVNKCLGWPNVHVAGRPVQGRSGGPLFSREGMVIGVCNADDKELSAGLFASIGGIQAELDEARLDAIYKATDPRAALAVVPVAAPAAKADAAVWQASPATPRVSPISFDTAADVRPANADVPEEKYDAAKLAPGEQTALEEVHRRMKEGAEVMVITHDRGNPDAKAEVFTLEGASPAFVNRLKATARAQEGPQPTSLDVPRPRKPILEWDCQRGYVHAGPIPTGGR